MKVYIYATEGTYQGLHGVYNCQVVDVSDIEEANEYGYEMAFNVAESYGLTDEDRSIIGLFTQLKTLLKRQLMSLMKFVQEWVLKLL